MPLCWAKQSEWGRRCVSCGAGPREGTVMGKDTINVSPVKWGVTLNSLRDELYSLHMRLLLAVQNHDTEVQVDLEAQIVEVQKQIEEINLRGRH